MDLSQIPKIPKNATIVKKYPSMRDKLINGCWRWIEGRTKDDNAKQLWRIHDRLYDLTDFVSSHPGGSYWLEITKGTDITEAFETHHLSKKPYEMLNQFYAEDATAQRNYFLTFDENGFYMTLKRRVAAKLKSDDTGYTWKSKMIHDINLVILFLSIVFAARSKVVELWILFNVIAAFSLALSVSFAHNFIHKADNWRMYSINLSMCSWRGMRVTHILSHHMYPNSYADYEMGAYEPYYRYVWSYRKPISYIIRGLILSPVVLTLYFHNTNRLRMMGLLFAKHKIFYWDEFMFLLLPLTMTLFGTDPISWHSFKCSFHNMNYFLLPAGLIYTLIFLNRGQHGCDRVHQNDQIKSFDFGEYQLTTNRDRSDVSHNHFTSLAFYGNEVLHHLFPTVDQALLPQLRSVLVQTCKDFNVQLDYEISTIESYINQIIQLVTRRCKLVRTF